MFGRTRSPQGIMALLLTLLIFSACSSAATGDAVAKEKSQRADAVALIEGKPVSPTDLLTHLGKKDYRGLQQALNEVIDDQILTREAAAQGIDKEALLEKEVTAKLAEPTQEEIDQLWEANKARMQGRTKEQVQPDIVKYLKAQKEQQTRQTYINSLKEKYEVKILMEPPRVEVAIDDDPFKGPKDAPVTIIEFSDFQCPYCSRVEATLKEVMEKYEGKVRLVYRDYPLGMHPQAPKAAEAAHCADEQGKFWEYHESLYAEQQKLTIPDLEARAERFELDVEKFKECLGSGKYAEEVEKDMADAQEAGVRSTPSFFINGVPLVGAQGFPAFAEIIDRELERVEK